MPANNADYQKALNQTLLSRGWSQQEIDRVNREISRESLPAPATKSSKAVAKTAGPTDYQASLGMAFANIAQKRALWEKKVPQYDLPGGPDILHLPSSARTGIFAERRRKTGGDFGWVFTNIGSQRVPRPKFEEERLVEEGMRKRILGMKTGEDRLKYNVDRNKIIDDKVKAMANDPAMATKTYEEKVAMATTAVDEFMPTLPAIGTPAGPAMTAPEIARGPLIGMPAGIAHPRDIVRARGGRMPTFTAPGMKQTQYTPMVEEVIDTVKRKTKAEQGAFIKNLAGAIKAGLLTQGQANEIKLGIEGKRFDFDQPSPKKKAPVTAREKLREKPVDKNRTVGDVYKKKIVEPIGGIVFNAIEKAIGHTPSGITGVAPTPIYFANKLYNIKIKDLSGAINRILSEFKLSKDAIRLAINDVKGLLEASASARELKKPQRSPVRG